MTKPWSVIFDATSWAQLRSHLFPGDRDEHGAVLGAAVHETPHGNRLLVRRVWLARDGVEYVPGDRGYRMLTPTFVRDRILDCADEQLSYLAVHCHGGTDDVEFSGDDMRSHERGYPALRALNDGQLVGGLVFARAAVAGDLWLPDGSRTQLRDARVVGRPVVRLYPTPPPVPPSTSDEYDRQARLFGDRGQDLLGAQKVAVIGAGGAGSLLVELLTRLGVGHLVVIDPERLEPSNIPRVVGSRRLDALPWLVDESRREWIRRLGRRLATKKVDVARRVARQANPNIEFTGIYGNIVDDEVARELLDCDHLFLAADTMQARLVFNAVVHQYLIPGTQVGAKVTVQRDSGDVLDVFAVSRPVLPDLGCLWCNGLINTARLQEEAQEAAQVQRQRYVDDPTVAAPSVITLNAVAVSHAANDYLFSTTGLLDADATRDYVRFLPTKADVMFDRPRKDPACPECGADGRYARGRQKRLPTKSA